MKVCSLSSGSKGNCTYIETENSRILLDVGVSLKYVLESLRSLNVAPETIDAILITHEHFDHIKGVGQFGGKFDTPIYCARSLVDLIKTQNPKLSNLVYGFDSSFEIKDLKVVPFELSHDSKSCVGYRLTDETGSVSFVTDTGYLPDNAEKIIQNSALVFLESNYDPDMLYACPYPIFLKKRIVSPRGHLSNLDSAKIIERLSKTGTRQVVLSHLSENSNTPYLAYNTIKKYLSGKNIEIGVDINISINYQMKINTIYKLNKKIN